MVFRAPAWVGGACLALGHSHEVWAPLELEHPWDGGTQLGYRYPPAMGAPTCLAPCLRRAQASVTWQDWGCCQPGWHPSAGCRAHGTPSSNAPRGSHVRRKSLYRTPDP